MNGSLSVARIAVRRFAVAFLVLIGALVLGGTRAAAQPTYDTNVLPNGGPSGATVSNTVEQDPQFYNPAGADGTLGTLDDDYRPDKPAGSPLVDFAADSYVATATAMNGQTQTETAWDAGAYEASGSALPVELSRFHATLDGERVRLIWATASETNNAGFAVERREAGRESWRTVGRVDGAGTTARERSYEFVDQTLPAADTLAYRLRQIDTDGSETLSDPVRVGRDAPSTLTIEPPTPNPAAAQATVRAAVPDGATDARLVVYDLLGRVLWSTSVTPGRSVLEVPASDLASGTYVVRLEADRGTATTRLTVVR